MASKVYFKRESFWSTVSDLYIHTDRCSDPNRYGYEHCNNHKHFPGNYILSRLPKRYPEAWAKNKFHFSNGALYTFCTVSIIIYTVIFVKGIFSIKVSYAVAAVIVMLALILIGIYLTKKGGIRIETSLWDPSVKKEEK